MTLASLIKSLGLTDAVLGGGDRSIESITADSRTARPGCLFVCMPSASRDTHDFLPQVAEQGAVAAIVHTAKGAALAQSLNLDYALFENPLPEGRGQGEGPNQSAPKGQSHTAQASEPPSPEIRGRGQGEEVDLPPVISENPLPQGRGQGEGPNKTSPAGSTSTGPQNAAFNRAVALLAHEILGQPTKKLRVLGVTGTNGKTTTAWMIRDALRAMGRRAAYMGTLGIDFTGERVELANTTPFPVETAQLLADAVAAGCEDFVMEVSSHALAENRVAGILFDAAVFTNLTQDHLDFHGSMEAYEEAKKLLYTQWADDARRAGKAFKGAVNGSNVTGNSWAKTLPDVFTYGVGKLSILSDEVHLDSLKIRAAWDPLGGLNLPELENVAKALEDGKTVEELGLNSADRSSNFTEATLKVGGKFNVENAGSALAGLVALEYTVKDACKALESITPVPGRFQAIPNDKNIGVIVDYAHTPDALEQLLKSVRDLEPNRIITVFGCGGDRDKTKRPKMAAVVSRLSNVAVVTSDNPRTEDPQSILNDVLAGIEPGTDSIDIIDRRAAIAHAVQIARPHDVVVIAGKGHEDYQIIGKTKHHMDDCELAAEALEAK